MATKQQNAKNSKIGYTVGKIVRMLTNRYLKTDCEEKEKILTFV